MRVNAIRLAALTIFSALAVSIVHAQAATEYGGLVGNSATAASSAKIKVPNMKVPDPGNANGSSASAAGQPKNISSTQPATPDAAAAANRQFLQSQAGANAVLVSLHSTPDHSQVFVDTRFVGAAPLELKLAPGHHDVMMRAPGTETVHESVELAAKESKQISLTLKPGASQGIVLTPH